MNNREKELNNFVSNLDTKYIMCRDTGHLWEDFTVHRDGKNYKRIIRCGRCQLERWQIINNRGFIISSHYENYPDGYIVPSKVGIGRLTRNDRSKLRLESLIREVE